MILLSLTNLCPLSKQLYNHEENNISMNHQTYSVSVSFAIYI